MATEITMPQMGFDMTEGTIAAWLKKEGDTVNKGEPIAEIETDKTTIQIEAFGGGVLRKIIAQAGQKVPVGETIGIIAAPDEQVDTPQTQAQSAPAPAPAPSNGATQPQAQKTEAGQAEAAQPEASPPAPTAFAPAQQQQQQQQQAQAPSQVVVNEGRIIATPVAKRLAEERSIDLRYVKGTGPEGRITKADVESFVPSAAPAPARAEEPIAKPVGGPVLKDLQPAEPTPKTEAVTAPTAQAAPAAGKKPLTRMRQTIATRMIASKQQVPHFYITVQAEMDEAMALRAQINDSLKPEGVKISVNDMVIRAVALALKRFPNVNSSFAGDGIEARDHVHVGNAVTVEGGLVTVTIRDTDAKTLKQISQEMVALADRARNNKMQPGDVGGQTFTISNLGMYGVENFIAIVNQPDAGILAVATATPTPVVRDGQVVIRTIMNMTLSGDHRVTDGAEGAQFINEIKRLLENPWSLVL